MPAVELDPWLPPVHTPLPSDGSRQFQSSGSLRPAAWLVPGEESKQHNKEEEEETEKCVNIKKQPKHSIKKKTKRQNRNTDSSLSMLTDAVTPETLSKLSHSYSRDLCSQILQSSICLYDISLWVSAVA